MTDVATALTGSVAADGQTPMSGALAMGTNKITGIANGAARTDVPATGQVQDGSFIYVGTVGGTGDAITLSPSPAITSYTAGQTFRFVAGAANTTNVTVQISGLAGPKAVTKNGTTALVANDILSGALVSITYDGTRFQMVPSTNLLATNSLVAHLAGTETITGTKTLLGAAVNHAAEASIASDATVNIGAAASNNILITGTTTITAFDNVTAGITRLVRFNDVLTLTHNGTSLILPGAGNITTAANDCGLFESLGSGNWICVSYSQSKAATGSSLVLIDSKSASSSASLDFLTGITSAYDFYELEFVNLIPGTTDVFIGLRISTDGVNFISTGTYSVINAVWYNGGAYTTESDTLGSIPLTTITTQQGTTSNLAGHGWSGIVNFVSPSSSTLNKYFDYHGTYMGRTGGGGGADQQCKVVGGGHWQSNTAIVGIQVIVGAGNIASGQVYLRAKKKT